MCIKNSITFLEGKIKDKEVEVETARKNLHKSKMIDDLRDLLTYEEVRELYLKKLNLIDA